MKMLVVSDSHMYNDILENITNKWKNKVDLLVHCGDSSLLPDNPLLKDYDIVVHGNHDEEVFPHYVVYKDIFVTHGNDYHVYAGYDELIKACKKIIARYVFMDIHMCLRFRFMKESFL